MRMLSPDWEAMFPPPGNPPHQYHHPQALVILGICPLPLSPQHPLLIYTIFFLLLCIGRNAPKPFFNQLLLSVNNFISWDAGYSLQHYLYYVITFLYLLAQNHMAHDSGSCASIRNQNSLSWEEFRSKKELFSYFSQNDKEIKVVRENTCSGLNCWRYLRQIHQLI